MNLKMNDATFVIKESYGLDNFQSINYEAGIDSFDYFKN